MNNNIVPGQFVSFSSPSLKRPAENGEIDERDLKTQKIDNVRENSLLASSSYQTSSSSISTSFSSMSFSLLTFNCMNGVIELPEIYREKLANISLFFKNLFFSEFREKYSSTINLEIERVHLQRMLDIAFSNATLPQEMPVEDLIEFGQKALFLNMIEAFQLVQSRLMELIGSLEFTQEHFDFAIDIQNVMHLLDDDEKVQEALDSYFQKTISDLGPHGALEFLKENGSNLFALDLTKFRSLDDAHLNQFIQCCPKLTKLSIKSKFISDKSLASICSAYPNLQKLELWSCKGLTNEGLKHIGLMTKLKSFGFSLDIQNRTFETLSNERIFLEKHGSKLTSLDIKLSYTNNDSHTIVSDKWLQTIFQNCPNLTSLSIEGPNAIYQGIIGHIMADKSITNICLAYPNLQKLEIERCTTIDDNLFHIASLQKLVSLKLSIANVSNTGVKHLASLKNLETLDLSWNYSLRTRGFAHLSSLVKLRNLILRSCEVEDGDLDLLAPLSNLEMLDLSSTKITDEGLLKLSPLENLKSLKLSKCKITDEGLIHLKPFAERLSTLCLHMCPITDQSLDHIVTLTNLRELWIGYTQITEKAISRLASLNKLRVLSLYGFRNLTGASFSGLASLNNLHTLFLNHSSMQRFADLPSCPNLQTIWLQYCPIKNPEEEDIAKLKDLKNLHEIFLTPTDLDNNQFKALGSFMCFASCTSSLHLFIVKNAALR